MDNIKARMITLREYQKYKRSKLHTLAKVNYLINTHYINNNDIVVYDDANNKYLVVNENGIIRDMKYDDKELTSYLVLDKSQVIDKLTTRLSITMDENNADECIAEELLYGNELFPGLIFSRMDKFKKVKFINQFNISMNNDKGTKFHVAENGNIYNFSNMTSIINEIMYKNRQFSEMRRNKGRKIKEIVDWTYGGLVWTFYNDDNILISENTYSDNLVFPLSDKETINIISSFSLPRLKYKNNKRCKNNYEEENIKLNEIYKKAKTIVQEKNKYLEKTPDKTVIDLFGGNKFKDGEYYMLPLSSKQVNITSEDKFYYEVRLDVLDLTINVEPNWYLKLKEKCREEYPLNVNLVIELKDNEIHNDIIDLVSTSKILNRWRLPENCCIVLKSSSKVSIEKHSAKKSTIFKYANDEYSTNNLNGGTEFISITQVTSTKINSANTIIDNFDVMSEIYLTLEFGNECEKVKNKNDIYINVPEEFYEELVLIPKRERVLQRIKQW